MENKINFTKTFITFLIFFLISEFLIVRPIRNRVDNNKKIQNTKNEIINEIKTQENDETGEDVIIENEYLKLNINTKGLVIDSAELKKYKINVNSNENVKLFNNKENDFYRLNFSWLSNNKNLELPDKNSIWNIEENIDNKIFSFKNNSGVTYKVIMSLDDKYMLNIEQIVENNSDEDLSLKTLWQLERYKEKEDLTAFSGGISYTKKNLKEIKYKKLNKKNIEFNDFDWGGLTDKYWLTAIINNNGKINFLKNDAIVKVQYISNSDLLISKKSSLKTENKIFIGAKDINILQHYKENSNIPMFDRSIDFGLFYIVAKPMSILLNFFFNNITHNFGLAIILLTIIVKLLLYPTVKKSFISMSKMKKAQPEIKRIQEMYKNDVVKMQQETLKLYKKYNFSPFSGILPIFIQIPIFFSLYKVISVSIYMRQAPLLGYLKDLSVADPTNILNLFGLLPFDINYRIGLLPCLMALTMYIQQKITEKTQINDKNTETTNNIVKYMPFMFLLMFSGFPSGLLLYWTFNNIITIFQQVYITKKYIKNNK